MSANTQKEPSEHAAWYVVLCRFIMLLLIAAFGLSFVISASYGLISLIEKANPTVQITPHIISAIEAHPISATIVLLVAFVAMLFWVCCKIANVLSRTPLK